MRGGTNYKNLSEHIIILGWHGLKTERMVDYIRGDEDSKDSEIVLCAAEDIENPMPDRVKFVRGTALNTPDLLTRAGAKQRNILSRWEIMITKHFPPHWALQP